MSKADDDLARFSSLPDEAATTAKTAQAILGISAPTLWRWAKDGRLTPIKIGPGATRFRVGQIRALLAA